MGSQSKEVKIDDVKGSKKCLLTGPILKESGMLKFRTFLENEAAKADENYERIEIGRLPEKFLFPGVKRARRIAIIATILFKSALGPAKLISSLNGQVYNDCNAIFVTRINEKATLADVMNHVGDPPEDFEDVCVDDDSDYDYSSDEDENDGEEDTLFHALVCGIYFHVQENAAFEIMESMDRSVALPKAKHCNITHKFNLDIGHENKQSYVFTLGFNSFEDREKASTEYLELLERNHQQSNAKFLIKPKAIRDRYLLDEIPEECQVYMKDRVLRLLNIQGLKIKHKQLSALVEKFVANNIHVGSEEKCKKCPECTNYYIKEDGSVDIALCCESSASKAQSALNGKPFQTFGIMSISFLPISELEEGITEEFEATDCDMVVTLPHDFKDAANTEEVSKIVQNVRAKFEVENANIVFPRQYDEGFVILLFRLKSAELVEKAIETLVVKGWNKELIKTPGVNFNFSDYDIGSDFNETDGKSVKPIQKIQKKIWLQFLKEAQDLEKQRKYDDARTAFMFVFTETIGKDLFQSIASDAAAGIAGVAIKDRHKDDEDALKSLLDDISEISDAKFITPKLVHQLANVFLLNGKVASAAMICLYGVINCKMSSQQFELLLLHINENYQVHLEALKNYMEMEKICLNDYDIKRLAVIANDLKLAKADEINADKKKFIDHGAIVFEKKEEVLPMLTSQFNNKFEMGMRHFRAAQFSMAASAFGEALEFVSQSEEKWITSYLISMAFLATKSLPDVKEGHRILNEMYETKQKDEWVQEFPAIFYGLAKYELAINEAEPKFLDVDLKNLDVSLPPEMEDRKVKEILVELDYKNLPPLLQKLKFDKPEVLATCKYDQCEKLHQNKNSILNWKPTICRQDLDYNGFVTFWCTEGCRIDFHSYCWKQKKKAESKNKDKDYLQEWCMTPDCDAPICKIHIVKDDPEKFIELKDDKMTEKMQIERKNKIPQAASVEKETFEEPNDDSKTIRDLRNQLERAKMTERNLNQQIQEQRNLNETLEQRNRELYKKQQQHQNELAERGLKSKESYDLLKAELDKMKGDHRKQTKKINEELKTVFCDEARKYQEFVRYVNNHLFEDASVELHTLDNNLDKRIDAFRKVPEYQRLSKFPSNPNYSNFFVEIANRAGAAKVTKFKNRNLKLVF